VRAVANSHALFVRRDNGNLFPETIEVLGIIAKEKLILATGHSSAEEDLLLVREARKLGISQIVVTHPLAAIIHMSIPQMKEAAELGAYIEFCGNALLPTQPKEGQTPVTEYLKAIRAIGPEHAILSGDFGQAVNPVHTDAWKQYLDIMRRSGFTPTELDLMTRQNPAALLGLSGSVPYEIESAWSEVNGWAVDGLRECRPHPAEYWTTVRDRAALCSLRLHRVAQCRNLASIRVLHAAAQHSPTSH
jgi:hypothetical protein